MHATATFDCHGTADASRSPGAAAAHAAEESRLLRVLPLDEHARLLPQLDLVELVHGQLLGQAEARIHAAEVPRTCVVSLLTPLGQDQSVEAATVGREGA